MYLGLSTATPIFIGGLLRWLADRCRGVSASEAETETSPGVLLSSGYIAGGTLCGLLWGFVVMGASFQVLGLPEDLADKLNLGEYFGKGWDNLPGGKLLAVAAFAVIGAILFLVGRAKSPAPEDDAASEVVA